MWAGTVRDPAAMLLTQVQAAAASRVPTVQGTPEHITGLFLPRGLEGSADQQPGRHQSKLDNYKAGLMVGITETAPWTHNNAESFKLETL